MGEVRLWAPRQRRRAFYSQNFEIGSGGRGGNVGATKGGPNGFRKAVATPLASKVAFPLTNCCGSPFGLVTVLAQVEDRTRKVSIALFDPDYQTAVLAHHEHRYVSVVGTVTREGRTYRLENPRGFSFASDDDDFQID